MATGMTERINRWALDPDSESRILAAYAQVEFLTERVFGEYVPTGGPSAASFRTRLSKWLDNAPDAEQQALLLLVPHLFFVGRDHFQSLCRAAIIGPICRWIIDLLGLTLDDPRLQAQLNDAIRSTWFCGITDSMDIREFYTVNGITVRGTGLRPSWNSLSALGDPDQISQYMTDNGLVRLVLLEDFVGSGSQMKTAVELFAELSNPVPMLLAPLIACPAGSRLGQRIAAASPDICYSPVLDLPANTFLTPAITPGEPGVFAVFRALVRQLARQVRGGVTDHWYGEFGFPPPPDEPTGALVVLFSNCPDNTIPLVHFTSPSWSPLFPRNSRL